MSQLKFPISLHILGLAATLGGAGCLGGTVAPKHDPQGGGEDGGAPATADLGTPAKDDPQLAQRELNYGLALRTASIKLVGDLPTLDEQRAIQAAGDPKAAYEKQIDDYLGDARFSAQLVGYFRNTFKMGGQLPGNQMNVSLETAPTFAAKLVVDDKPFTDVLTASSNTCPTFAAGAFMNGDCQNGVPARAGVLTDPGVQAQFTSNMAFRRVRWLQETFDCRKFPTEYSQAPQNMGAGVYTSPWPFESVSGGSNVPVDFHDTKSVICANCHTTMNHLAPLFGNFDGNGMWQSTIQVTTPVKGLPKTKLTDWLPPGENTAWRFGVAVSDLPNLGAAMAKDPEVASCMVVRVYDWAMSKDDVVTDLATVPEPVIAPYRDDFVAGGYKLKRTIKKAFTSDDFVRF
jgi:hypothetical protein